MLIMLARGNKIYFSVTKENSILSNTGIATGDLVLSYVYNSKTKAGFHILSLSPLGLHKICIRTLYVPHLLPVPSLRSLRLSY